MRITEYVYVSFTENLGSVFPSQEDKRDMRYEGILFLQCEDEKCVCTAAVSEVI